MKSHANTKLTDTATLRSRARQHIEDRTLTDSYGADRDAMLRPLNQVLTTEIVCSLRYKRHYDAAKSLASATIAGELLEHAHEEENHADQFAERNTQLGGDPDFSPERLAERSHAEHDPKDDRFRGRRRVIAAQIRLDSFQP
jgi:bacterioferritin